MKDRVKKLQEKRARRQRRLALAKSKKKNVIRRVNKVVSPDFNRSLWSPDNRESSKKSGDVLKGKQSKIFDKSAWQNPPSAPRP